jgi:hypothetical protein
MTARPTWAQHPNADARRRSAVNVARLALAADDILDEHRHWLLSVAVWKYTEADGKYSDGEVTRSGWRILPEGQMVVRFDDPVVDRYQYIAVLAEEVEPVPPPSAGRE